MIYQSETNLKLKSRKISFSYPLYLNCAVVLNLRKAMP